MESADERRAAELYEKHIGTLPAMGFTATGVLAAIQEAIRGEREQCAKLCENRAYAHAAKAIRSRTSGKDGG